VVLVNVVREIAVILTRKIADAGMVYGLWEEMKIPTKE
jgi:hypothetical protein